MTQQSIFHTDGALLLRYLYVSRKADQDITSLLNRKKSIYLQGAKQMGKSSFFMKFTSHLRSEGWICCIIDLATLKNFKRSKWFRHLGGMIAKECKINPIQSSLKNQIDFRSFLLDEIGIQHSPIKLALLFDEVESLLSLNFSDAFLMTLRDIHQQRDSYSGQLQIVLTGSIDPLTLIEDPNISPYNIAEEIVLEDFSEEECRILTDNLSKIGIPVDEAVYAHIYNWTKGHPYLTQRICEIIEGWAEAKRIVKISTDVIDEVIQADLLSPRRRDKNIKQVSKEIIKLKSSPTKLWKRLLSGKIVYSTEAGFYALYLTGAIKESFDGRIEIRNRVYEAVFGTNTEVIQEQEENMDYKQGFALLKESFEQRAPDSLPELYTLEERFNKNEQNERIFGNSENVRNERSQVIYSLNQLAYNHCGKSFNELCENQSPNQQTANNSKTYPNQSSGDWELRQISIILQNKIIDFLTALPSVHGSNAQQAFIYGAGLDQELQGHISLGGPPAQFFKLLVQMLSGYELLRDGRDALEAVLESAKGYVGTNKRSYCDTLIRELRKERQESPQAQEQSADRLESSKENTVQNSENLPVDFAFITALEKEAKALVGHFEHYHTTSFEEHDIRTYHCGTIPILKNNREYRVVAVLLPNMGEVAAANAVTDTITRWKPKFLVMLGIAGGIPLDDLDLGDVVVADQIIGYEYGKLTDEEFKPRDRVYPTSALLLERVRNFWDESWNQNIDVIRPEDARRSTSKHFVGPIASGNKVIASTEFRNQLKSRWSKLVALEMEGEGVFAAAFDRPQEQIPATLIIRGISDMADERKSDEWQEYAANAAAAFSVSFLKSGPVDPRT